MFSATFIAAPASCVTSANRNRSSAVNQRFNSARMNTNTPAQMWICTSCGFIYDPAEGDPDGGVPPGTAFTEIVTGFIYAPYTPSMLGGFIIFSTIAFAGQLFRG